MRSYALLALAAVPAAIASPIVARTDNRRHFYTTQASGEMAKQGGYTYNGITAYAFTSQVSGSVPMYRCYNGPQDLHFYTTDAGCEGAQNYHVETTAWYCYQNQVGNTLPLNRYTQQNGDHWYIKRGDEQGQGDIGYYTYEGTACFVYANAGQADSTGPIYNWYRGTDY